jgi:hypothetical protein
MIQALKNIAEEANKCCSRSDGYEEALVKYGEDQLSDSISTLRALCEDTDKLYERWRYYDEPLTIDDLWKMKERLKSLLGRVT